MGACLACFWPSPTAKSIRPPVDVVRVVHINGFVEDFDGPVTAIHVAGRYPKHMLCTSAHLLTFGASPFRPTERLQPGQLYFLLPNTVFQAESSPMDLATLMNRLTAMAAKRKSTGSGAGGGSAASSAPGTPTRGLFMAPPSPGGSSVGGGMASFISRLGGGNKAGLQSPSPTSSLYGAAPPKLELVSTWQSPARVGMWKPQLDPITEKTLGGSMERTYSFNGGKDFT